MDIMTRHNLSRWWLLLLCLQSLVSLGQCGWCPFGFGQFQPGTKSKLGASTTEIADTQLPTMLPFQAKAYLLQYGYIDTCSGVDIDTEDSLSDAILMFQRWANLNLTSKLDNETLAVMTEARCGNKDVLMEGDHISDELLRGLQGEKQSPRRRKRYTLQGSRWKKQHLTYSIHSYTADLPTRDVERTIGQAFQVWSDVTPLTFTYSKCKPVDIEIVFTSDQHNDGNPFDGPGGVLAHAFFPFSNDESRDGDLHFDDAEQWVLGSNLNGTNLLIVAVHELGHSLGLSHSQVYASIMWPWAASKVDANIELHPDDIDAIQEIYGRPSDSDGATADHIPANCTIWHIERNTTEYAWNISSWDPSTWNTSDWNAPFWNASTSNTSDWDTSEWNTTFWNPSFWNTSSWNTTLWTANTSSWDTFGWNTTSWNSTWNITDLRPGIWNSSRWNTSFWNMSDAGRRVYNETWEHELTTDEDNVPDDTTTTTQNRDWIPDWTIPVVVPVEEQCSGRIDAITVGPHDKTTTVGHRDKIYAFRDNNVFIIGEHGVIPGYPKQITDVFPGGPNRVDAAFSAFYTIYLIQDGRCWRYFSNRWYMRLEVGYPRTIRDAFGIKSLHIDAVFHEFTSTKKKASFNFLSGDTYWEVNFHKRGKVETKHRPLYHHRRLQNLPAIQAAFRDSKGETYFFTADSYYRYKSFNERVSGPYDTTKWLFNCLKSTITDRRNDDVYYGAWRDK